MRNLLLAALFPLTATGALAQGLTMPEALQDRLADRRSECVSMGSTLSGEDKAVTAVEKFAGGETLWVFDDGVLSCSGSASSDYCGSGGCSASFLVGSAELNMLIYSWEMVPDAYEPTLRITTKGDDCGGAKMQTCLNDYVWQNGALSLKESQLK